VLFTPSFPPPLFAVFRVNGTQEWFLFRTVPYSLFTFFFSLFLSAFVGRCGVKVSVFLFPSLSSFFGGGGGGGGGGVFFFFFFLFFSFFFFFLLIRRDRCLPVVWGGSLFSLFSFSFLRQEKVLFSSDGPPPITVTFSPFFSSPHRRGGVDRRFPLSPSSPPPLFSFSPGSSVCPLFKASFFFCFLRFVG